MNPRTYIKAIIGALIAGLTALATGLATGDPEGVVTAVEWISVAIATLGTFGGVYGVRNKEAEPKYQPKHRAKG